MPEPFAAGTPPPPVPPPQPRAPGPVPAPPPWRSPQPGDPREPPRPGRLDDRERRLDPAVVHVWRLVGATSSFLPLAGLVLVGFLVLGGLGWIVAVLALAVFVLLVTWYPSARYARWRWQLTPLALELRYGVLVHRHEAVPYFRIQQIDISQGPIDRALRLATLQVTTASASGSAALPGMSAEDAPGVRAELLARAAQAVGEHPGDLQDAV